MARISDVVSSSRETSPDPITLPSSPLVAHSARKTRSSVKPSPRKMNRRSATPAKSVILDTPTAGNESPWRIKVTVEAEPRDGSPGKRMARTTSVPLNDSPKKRSSSPSKRASAQRANGGEVKRPARKRKGTPLRDTRPARPQPEPETATEEDDAMPQRSHSPARRASGRLARLSQQPGSARIKRLSYARDELDQALQNAVGYSDGGFRCDAPGDMTTSKNEDFSMISMESLQTAKETSMSNVMATIPEGENSAATVSHMDSSPPKVRYPNIERKAEKARSSLGKSVAYAHDPMSWKPTGILKKSSSSSVRKQQEQTSSHERQWQKERESVSQQIASADPQDVHVVDDAEAMDDDDEGAAGVDEDIWQDEASRELEDRSIHQSRRAAAEQPKRSPQIEDLFAGQPLKPARSKIPRTWRRSSGMDFSYVDSPAHEPMEEPEPEPEDEEEDGEEEEEEEEAEEEEDEPERHTEVQTQDRRHSTDGSGVLTPPSTEDSEEESDQEAEEEEEYEESEFEPDAEATRVQDVEEEADVATPGSDDSSSSPEGDDTGNFFQTNLPQVYMKERPRRRPPRQKTMDLTELLNLDGANSPAKAAVTGSQVGAGGSPKVHRHSSSQAKRSPLQMRDVTGRVISSSSDRGRTKVVDSPLRKSLLRSSKMQGSPAPVHQRRATKVDSPQGMQHATHTRTRSLQMPDADPGDSFESKASDQRQLLSEAATHEEEHSQHYDDYEDYEEEDEEMMDDMQPQTPHQPYVESEEYYEEEEAQDMEEEEEYYEEEEVTAGPSRSYEERLNLDSPQKINVNFNDSKTSSSWLTDRKDRPPFFDLPNAPRFPRAAEQPAKHLDSPGTITLVDKKPAPAPPQPGFFSRLSTTFWNAVIGTPSPTDPLPTQEECTALFSPRLRSEIRQRYGVISEEHPWTFVQMRTLQRMLNSLTSNRYDSIIPRSGPLPLYLENLIGTYQPCIVPAGREFYFRAEHAYVVLSFFQVTVSKHLIEAMRRGEVEWLGDGAAAMVRGDFGGNYGDEVVFTVDRHGRRVADWVDSHRGRVGMDFVVRALGTCVDHNAGLERKWGLSFEEIQRRGLLGKEPED